MMTHNLTINQPPIANFEYTPTSPVKANTSIEFMDKSTDADGNISSWVWNFGDGSTAQGTQITHTYTEEGIYTITLTVTDDDGETDSFTLTITVQKDEEDGGGTPGFEVALLVIAIISLIIIVRKKR